MAILYVSKEGKDSNNGSESSPVLTLGRAVALVKEGDTVLIGPGVWHEELKITAKNTTWRGQRVGETILDGGYDETKKGKGPAGTLPGDKNAGMISLRAPGIIIDGCTIRNIGGCGINGTGCDGGTIINCTIDHTYVSGIKISPDKLIEGFTIEDNVCTRSGMQSFDNSATGGKDPGGGVIKIGRTKNAVVRGNVCGMSYGEGINLGKGNVGVLCEENEVFLVAHKHIYVNRSTDVIVRNNIVWFAPGYPDIEGDKDAPGAIAIGDECGNLAGDKQGVCRNNASFPKTARVQIYNNLVVNLGVMLHVANGLGKAGSGGWAGGYDTTLEDCYIGYNTLVAGPLTRQGINIGDNMRGNPHVNSFFENNIVDWTNAPAAAEIAVGDPQGMKVQHNLWSVAPAAKFKGSNDVNGDPGLANAAAPINWKGLDSDIDLSNYFLRAGSKAVGAGVVNAKGGTDDMIGDARNNPPDLGALSYYDGTEPEEPPVDPPVDPPTFTPIPDWVTYELESLKAQLMGLVVRIDEHNASEGA